MQCGGLMREDASAGVLYLRLPPEYACRGGKERSDKQRRTTMWLVR